MNPQHFGSDPADIRIRIKINPEIQIRIPDHFQLTFGPWLSLRSLGVLLFIIIIFFLLFLLFDKLIREVKSDALGDRCYAEKTGADLAPTPLE